MYRPSPYSLERYVRPTAAIETGLDYGRLPPTSCGYAPLNAKEAKAKLPADIRALMGD